MTGNELVKAIKAHRGKVQVRALFGADVAYIYAEKQDLLQHFAKAGDTETGVSLQVQNDDAFIDTDY